MTANDQLKYKIECQTAENEEMRTKLTKMNVELSDTNNEIGECERQLSEMDLHLNEVSLKLSQNKSSNASIQQQISDRTAELIQLKSELRAKQIECERESKLMSHYDHIMRERDEHWKALSVRETEELCRVQQNVDQLRNECHKLSQMNAQKGMKDLVNEKNELQKEMEKHLKDNKSLKESCDRLNINRNITVKRNDAILLRLNKQLQQM